MAGSNTASNVRVVLREGYNQTRIHEYTPINAKVINNGRKKPDELECTLSMGNIAGVNDTIHYIEDPVDLTYCDAIWNFQMTARDERGYNFDPSHRAENFVECVGVLAADNCFINGLQYLAVATPKTNFATFDMSGTDAETALDLCDSINNDLRIPDKDFDLVAITGVGADANKIFMYVYETSTTLGNEITLSSNDAARLPIGGATFFNATQGDVAESRFKEDTAGKFQGNYYLDFANADEEVDIPIEGQAYSNGGKGTFGRWTLNKQFDINIWTSPANIPGIGNITPVIWSQYDGTYGLDIGIIEEGTTGKWYLRVRYAFGSGETILRGTSAVVFEEGVTDQTPRHIRICRGGDNIIRLFAMGEEDEVSSVAVASSLENPAGRLDIRFGSDNGGTLDYAGKMHQIKLYSGNILTEDQYFKSVGSKAQPISMKFGGQIWDKKDKTTTKKIMAQSYSKDLNNFKITIDAITKISLGSVARGAVGGEDAFYTGDFSPPLQIDPTPQSMVMEDHNSIQGIYILSTTANQVTQYSLIGNTFNLASAVPYSPARSFSVNSQDVSPVGLSIDSSDETNTHWFMCGLINKKVHHYIMSTGQDISSSVYQGTDDDYDFSAQTSSPVDMFMQTTTGKDMYILDGGKIYWYVLGTPLDPSTAVYQSGKDLDVSAEDSNMRAIYIQPDGNEMYLVGTLNDKIYHYTMTTDHDLGTAILQDTFDLSSELDEPKGIWVNQNGGQMIVMSSDNDQAYRYQQRIDDTLAAANRYGAGEMDDIIRDLINNLDDTYIVRTLAPMPTQWKGDFLADGTFSEIVNLLLVRGELTYYITGRKVLIIEKQVEFSNQQKTNHQFYQIDPTVNTKTTGGQSLGGVAGVFNSYKIETVKKNDGKLINEITLLGARDNKGTVEIVNKQQVVEGDTVHSLRINVPQLGNVEDLDGVRDAVLNLSDQTQPQYTVESPNVFIPHIRFNHLVKIFNAMIKVDGAIDGYLKVEAIETNYPSGKVILTVNQYPINFFELSRTETVIVDGLQSDTAIPIVFIAAV